MFEPRLRLIPETDGQFSLLAETDVPSSFYTAAKTRSGPPKGLTVGAHAKAVTLPLKYKPKPAGGEPRVVFHRAFDLDLSAGEVLKAYLTLDDKILAEASIIVASRSNLLVAAPAPRAFGVAPPGMTASVAEAALTDVELTIQLCEAIVVETTPSPQKFTVVTQQLHELGVIDDTRARFHKLNIRQRLSQHGFKILTTDIQSGPATKVEACADSVFQNATV